MRIVKDKRFTRRLSIRHAIPEAIHLVRRARHVHHPEGAGVTPEVEILMNLKKRLSLRGIHGWFVLASIATSTLIGCGPDGNNTSGSSSSGGGGAGGNAGCLDETTYADVLTIKDAGFCVVGAYDVDNIKGTLSWGRHGGPMFVAAAQSPAGAIDITRLTAPMSPTGKLTSGTNTALVALAPDAILGGQIVDLPFFNWSLISFTKADALFTGGIIVLEGNNVVLNYPINGFFSAVGTSDGGTLGRVLYSGLSPIYKNASNKNALHGADACGMPGTNAALVSSANGDPGCSDTVTIDAFGDYSGPVAADKTGNVFVVMSSMAGDQEARGYAADSVKRGAGPTVGTSMFKLPGFAGSLAAVSPEAGGTGVVVFQPQEYDAMAMKAVGKEVVAQRFTVDGTAIADQGVAGPFMTPTTAGEVFNFINDDQDRIWVAGKRGTGFVMLVLARKN